MSSKKRIIRPQPGPQEKFLSSPADIVIFGGEAGGSKTYSLLMDPLRWVINRPDRPDIDPSKFGGAIFRRTSPQLTGSGSIWEEACGMYGAIGANMIKTPSLMAKFPTGAMLQFLHLQHESNIYDHQGKQYAFLGFDELTHFTERQFWYLVTRLRSVSGVKPYLRATCNPDPDSFVRDLIDWWIDRDTGYPIPERDGALRWFVRDSETLFWFDNKPEADAWCKEHWDDYNHDEGGPMSLTFIRSRLDDNPALLAKDPSYRSKLRAQPTVERERLMKGNWNIRHRSGDYLKTEWFEKRWHTGDRLPPMNIYTSSDFAVTEPAAGKDPDYTEHGVFGVDSANNIYVLDWWWAQTTADVWIDALIDKWAKHKPETAFVEAGVILNAIKPILEKRMGERRTYCTVQWVKTPHSEPSPTRTGFADPSKRAKARRGRAIQALASIGKVIFPANEPWAERVISQITAFPDARYDDAFDVLALLGLGVNELHGRPPDEPQRLIEQHDPWLPPQPAAGSWKTE